MKLLYKPVGLLCGLIASLISRRLFSFLWALIDREEPPSPTVRDVSTSKVILSAALRGATQAGTRVAVDRAGARTFEHLVGSWPGPEKPEPVEE